MAAARYIDSVKNPRISGFVWPEPQEASDLDWFRTILEEGGTAFYNDPRRGISTVGYSVGFYLNFLQPEILVVGLSHPVVHRGIQRIRAGLEVGQFLKAGDERADIFEVPHPVKFATVSEDYFFDYLDHAAWFYRSLFYKVEPQIRHKFPVFQAIWADENGFYPDDSRCDETVRRVQTLKELP